MDSIENHLCPTSEKRALNESNEIHLMPSFFRKKLLSESIKTDIFSRAGFQNLRFTQVYKNDIRIRTRGGDFPILWMKEMVIGSSHWTNFKSENFSCS